jgi:anti-sigma B factor antagonist
VNDRGQRDRLIRVARSSIRCLRSFGQPLQIGREVLVVMSGFSTREQSEAVIVEFDNAAGLNDFRNHALRDELYDMVQSRAEPRVALDLFKIDYLSSSGVAILVGLKRRIDTRNGKIVFFHVQPIVRDLLKVMKLDRYFPLVDDEQAAIESLRPASTI